MGKDEDYAPWREIGRAAAMICAAVVLYTVGVAFASFDRLLA